MPSSRRDNRITRVALVEQAQQLTELGAIALDADRARGEQAARISLFEQHRVERHTRQRDRRLRVWRDATAHRAERTVFHAHRPALTGIGEVPADHEPALPGAGAVETRSKCVPEL